MKGVWTWSPSELAMKHGLLGVSERVQQRTRQVADAGVLRKAICAGRACGYERLDNSANRSGLDPRIPTSASVSASYETPARMSMLEFLTALPDIVILGWDHEKMSHPTCAVSRLNRLTSSHASFTEISRA